MKLLLSDPRVSPIHVSDKLPPAHIFFAVPLDGLMAGSKILAEKLKFVQGIENEEFYYKNMPHGFLHFEDYLS